MKDMILHLTLPLPVSLNQLYINEFKWNPSTKKREPSGKHILSDKGLMNKKLIQKEASKQIKKQTWDYEYTKENFIYLDTIIYFNRTNRDDNNLYKILCDSLEKICYDNDSRVLVRTQRIYYDAKNPHIEVFLSPVTYIGIFDNEQELNEFTQNCESCRYYQNGKCSILNNAKEGRIQEEIENSECKKYTEKKTK